MSMSVKDILNKYKWSPDLDALHLQIYYISRENGEEVHSVYLSDCDISSRGYIEFRNLEGEMVCIPFHRIEELVYDEKVVWRRWVNDK